MAATITESRHVSTSPNGPRHRRWLLVTLALGAFVGMADATVVAVALDPLTRHFGAPLASGQEVIGIYLVTVTATLPTLGRLGDRFGRRRAYLGGFAVFALGSVLAALAPGYGLLLAGRTVQAVGGGLLTAGSLALIAEHAPRRGTGRSVAILVVTQAVAGLVGPPLGGLLVALGGWQAAFWVGLPLAAVGIALTLVFVPPSAAGREMTIDVPGAVLLAAVLLGVGAGISSLAAPVIGDIPAIAWFSIAWIALLLLVPAELIARRPVVDGRMLRQPRFASATVATLLSTGTLMSCFALLPYWLEQAHDIGAIVAGLAFLPIGIGIGATSRIGGRLGDAERTGTVTTAGMVIAALGFGLAALSTQGLSWPALLAGLLLVGCGNGLFSSPNTAAAISLAKRNALGSAAGLLSTARNAGVITGLGVTGAVYTAAGASGGDGAAALIFLGAAAVCLAVALIAAVTYRGVRLPARRPAVSESGATG